MVTDKNYYELLEIKNDASKYEIKKAFYAQSKKWHPDVCKKENATEMFQLINKAYQTLYDDQSRKEYDEYLNQNSSKFENFYCREDYFDVTILNKYMSRPFNKNEMDNLINSLNISQIIFLYEYFWITFWSGSSLSEALLKNNSLREMFIYFMDHEYLRNYLFDKVSENNDIKKIIETNSSVFERAINHIINEFKNKTFTEKTKGNFYNFMVNVINEDNVFDSEISAILATKSINNVLELFKWFETIYHECYDLENIRDRNLFNDKFSHKKSNVKITSFSTGITILILIFLFLIIFKAF